MLPPTVYPRAAAASGLSVATPLAALLIYGVVRRSGGAVRAGVALVALTQLEQLVIYLPSFWGAAGPHRVWEGKTLELLTFLGVAAVLRLSPEESALRLPTGERRVAACVRAVALGLGFGLILSLPDLIDFAHGHWLPPWRSGPDVLGFELTMPGLSEEVCYRGALLGALDRWLGRPWRALGVNFGPGALLSSLMFALAHTVFFDRGWRPVVIGSAIFEFLVFALVMCWLRYRTGSVWPAIIAHNFNNGFEVLGSALRNLL